MAYRKNAKTVSFEIESGISRKFSAQRKVRGQVQSDAATAALRVWICLPEELQAVLISNPPKDVYRFICEKILDAETAKFFAALDPESRKRAFEAAIKNEESIFGDK